MNKKEQGNILAASAAKGNILTALVRMGTDIEERNKNAAAFSGAFVEAVLATVRDGFLTSDQSLDFMKMYAPTCLSSLRERLWEAP